MKVSQVRYQYYLLTSTHSFHQFTIKAINYRQNIVKVIPYLIFVYKMMSQANRYFLNFFLILSFSLVPYNGFPLQNMSSDSEDEWYDNYPRNICLILSPSNHAGVMIRLSTETKLPHRHKCGRGEVYVVYNDLSISFNGNR